MSQKKNLAFLLSCVLTTSLFVNPLAYGQNSRFELKNDFKPITLNQVIQQGLKDNHDQRSREMQSTVLDLQWAGVWDTFWVPTLTLNLSSGPQHVATVRKGTNGTLSPTAPSGAATLNMGDYTVFNWGKDYLDYLNNKQTIKRSKQSLTEGKRALKHQIIISYFDVITKKEIEVFMRDQIRHASFMYRLNREKVSAQKISRLEYQQARSEFLRAQTDYYDAKRVLDQAQEDLAFLVDDAPGTRYVLQETLAMKESKIELNEAREIAKKNSPGILGAKLGDEVADRLLEKARRENLPLPKFSINLGAYSQSFGRSSYVQEHVTSTGSSSIELVATLNATWTIYGDAGLFNKRDLQEASLNKGIATRNLLKSRDLVDAQLNILHDRIENYQKQLSALEPRVKTARKTYEVAMDNYTKKNARFPDFLIALRDLTVAEIAYSTARFQHLKTKVEFANMTGVEDFPGERFEDLALKSKSFEDIIEENEDLNELDAKKSSKKKTKPKASTESTESVPTLPAPPQDESESAVETPTPTTINEEVITPEESVPAETAVPDAGSETLESIPTPPTTEEENPASAPATDDAAPPTSEEVTQ